VVGLEGRIIIPRAMIGSFPAIPALATTISILLFGECANAALKTESWSDQTRTSHLVNWTLICISKSVTRRMLARLTWARL
jgi:hypothetical protein